MQQVIPSLDRVVRQYRNDVNHLAAPATVEALTALEAHLGRSLPAGLRGFLLQHNGADLLRSTLRLRSTAEISIASEETPQVVLFADGKGVIWAYAPDPGGYVFGNWDGTVLHPLHGSFSGWLKGSLAVLESKVRDARDQDALRFEADPGDIQQLIQRGRSAIEAGEPEEAEAILRRVTVNDPSRVLAWQYLGEALAFTDRTAAQQAWLVAFRRTELPLPWPGAPCLDAAVVRRLQQAFTDPELFEEELEHFLNDRIDDVHFERSANVVIAAGRALAQSRVRRGKRELARTTLSRLVSRCHGFKFPIRPWDMILELAELEVQLGNHDEAEALLRRIRHHGSPENRAQALLLLATISTARQEPWAEDILRDAERAPLSEVDQVRWAILATERALRSDHLAVAERQLERALALARRVALPVLSAAVKVIEGDVHRAHDRWDEALDAWTAGQAALTHRADAELTGRLHTRFGDAAVSRKQFPEAERHYVVAAQCFRDHELVVREAWVLLRLARIRQILGVDATEVLRGALTRFQQADLAAGVAAHDAVLGDPGAHLDWHLLRARDHARARYDAQRARPPHSRADADRPERRLGAHRLAIAACNDAIVEPLTRRMDAATRAIDMGRTTPKDDSVLHYIGAVDLLSGHRSWAAAEVLLRHLMEQRVDGHAWLALQGAIARSPNAAMVHGLLEHIELPKGKPNPALAAAAELLGIRRELHAVGPLIKLAQRPHSPRVREAAIVALGRIGDLRAKEVLLAALSQPKLAEQAALSLLLLGDRRGLDFHGKALIERHTTLTGLPGELLGRYGGPDHLLLLISASDGEGPMALGALQGLGLLGDPRAIPTLMAALSRRDRKIVDIAGGALELITGHHEDDAPGFRSRWHSWWEGNLGSFQEGTRHREGKVFSIDFLLERMCYDDPWVRRTAYDELCITTGQRLPFDAEGPWRLQVAHLRGWHKWWVSNKERFVPGGWYLAGHRIG